MKRKKPGRPSVGATAPMSVHIFRSQHRKLKKISKEEKDSLSKVVRDILWDYLGVGP